MLPNICRVILAVIDQRYEHSTLGCAQYRKHSQTVCVIPAHAV
jgi:hypothetical protein